MFKSALQWKVILFAVLINITLVCHCDDNKKENLKSGINRFLVENGALLRLTVNKS